VHPDVRNDVNTIMVVKNFIQRFKYPDLGIEYSPFISNCILGQRSQKSDFVF
jgi:hypothetical protein